MHYTAIEASVRFRQSYVLDIDGDGSRDFYLRTELVGDPQEQVDKLQFYAISTINRNLLNDQSDQSPVLDKGQNIGPVHPGYTWWQISAIMLCQKITHMDGSETWEGLWKTAAHRYLPVQVLKGGNLYYGWIELSMDPASGTLTVHRAALSKEAGKEVKAGF